MLPIRAPSDTFPYEKLPNSRLCDAFVHDGSYVYVQDPSGGVWIAENGIHLHPRILGGGQSAAAAGELLVKNGNIIEVDNVSGTFQFGPETLPQVIDALQRQGARVAADAARPFRWES
jgi:hypothetical protein